MTETLLESRAVRLRAGRVHRRVQAKPGLLERRPAAPCSSTRSANCRCPAGEAPARDRGARGEPHRLGEPARHRRPLHRGDEPRPGSRVARGVPPRLYFRLNGVTFTIPRSASAREIFNCSRPFSPRAPRRRARRDFCAAIASLRAHGWPGNVRELRNAVERALMLCDWTDDSAGTLQRPVPFAPTECERRRSNRAAVPPGAPSAPAGTSTTSTRILAALAACGGNQSRAARQLGISRKVLMARLDRYGVARPKKPGTK